jgi:hypothetical protein
MKHVWEEEAIGCVPSQREERDRLIMLVTETGALLGRGPGI